MTFDWSIIWEYRWPLLQAAGMTVLLTIATMALALPGGLILVVMRQSQFRIIRLFATWFVEFFRNLPLILLVYFAYYALPIFTGLRFSAFTTALVALGLNVSAYNSEIFRAGVNSIRKGQTEAALALGMSRMQVAHIVVIPQALRRTLPVLASAWVSLFKDTALVSVIGVHELAYTALQIRAVTFRVLELLVAMAGLYWLMGYPQAKLVDWIYKKYGANE